MVKYMELQGVKLEKEDVEVSDLAIRVRILCESDLILYLFMVLVVSRNGESSLMPSIIIGTYGICMYFDKYKIKKSSSYFNGKAANDWATIKEQGIISII